MASGGLGGSFVVASDAYYDYRCSSCEDDGRNNEASFYCSKCGKQFCDKCEQLHSKLHRDHPVLTRKDIGKWRSGTHHVTMETCDHHPRKGLDMFCADHDTMCCVVCIIEQHKSCKKLVQLTDAAKGIRNSKTFQRVLKDAPSLQGRLDNLVEKKKKNRAELQETCNNILSKVKEKRKELDALVDSIENATVAEVKEQLATHQSSLDSDIKECEQICQGVKKRAEDMSTKVTTDEVGAFSAFKKCEGIISGAETFIKLKQVKKEINFTFNDGLVDFLLNTKMMGEFDMGSNVKSGAPLHVYKVKSVEEHDVRVNDDNERCEIRGCCRLPNGNMVLIDANNKKVKLFNNCFKLLATHLTSSTPQCVECMTDNTLAVAAISAVYIFDASNDRLKQRRSLYLDVSCIVSEKGSLLMSISTSIKRYSVDGNCTGTVIERVAKDHNISAFALSRDNTKIYVTCYRTNALLTYDREGTLLTTFTDKHLKGPRSVCTASNGNLFVTCEYSNSILQMNADGTRILSTITEGVHKPEGLWIDDDTNELIVGQVSDKLMVMKLE